MTGPVASEARSAARRPAVAERRMLALDAFLDLLLEGHVPPTSEQVARRAGISMATFFRYFDSLGELRREASARILQRFPHLYRVPDIGAGHQGYSQQHQDDEAEQDLLQHTRSRLLDSLE